MLVITLIYIKSCSIFITVCKQVIKFKLSIIFIPAKFVFDPINFLSFLKSFISRNNKLFCIWVWLRHKITITRTIITLNLNILVIYQGIINSRIFNIRSPNYRFSRTHKKTLTNRCLRLCSRTAFGFISSNIPLIVFTIYNIICGTDFAC